jgi:drug/metabolite transporter (DMT)-like permease
MILYFPSLQQTFKTITRTKESILQEKTGLYIISAAIAVLSMTGYQVFIKKIPGDVNPVVSVIAIYLVGLIVCVVLLPFFLPTNQIISQVQKIGWPQIIVGFTIVGIEIGFLLMYRSGWTLSTGYIMTSVAVNIALLLIGLLFFSEKLSAVNVTGVLLCIVGVAMVGFKPEA